MPKAYTFEVVSATIPKPNAKDIEKEIEKLVFNKQAQSYKRPLDNFNFEKKV